MYFVCRLHGIVKLREARFAPDRLSVQRQAAASETNRSRRGQRTSGQRSHFPVIKRLAITPGDG